MLAQSSTARHIASRPHLLNNLAASPSHRARAARLFLLVLVAALGILALSNPIKSLEEPFVYRKDLVQEYILAKAILARDNPYLVSVNPQDLMKRYIPGFHDPRDLRFPSYAPSAHPPTVGALSIPFSLLNYTTMATLWLPLELLATALSVLLLTRATGYHLSLWGILAVTMALLAWYPLTIELALGQLTLVQLPLLTGSWWALRVRRPITAGVLVAFVILIKPTLWPLFLVFLLRGEWRALLASATAVAIGWAITFGLAGADTIVTYFTQALPAVNAGYRAQSWNDSLWTIGWKFFEGAGSAVNFSDTTRPVIESHVAAQLLSAALPAAALLLGGLAVRRGSSTPWAFALMICVSILISPVSWSFYLILTLVPVTMVLEWLVRHRMPLRQTNVALLVAIMLIIPPEVLADFVAATFQYFHSAIGYDTRSLIRVVAYMEPTIAVAALAWLVTTLQVGARAPVCSRAPEDAELRY